MGESVIAGADTPPVLEPAEHVFDLVALAEEVLSYSIWTLQVAFDGMQGVIPRSVRA